MGKPTINSCDPDTREPCHDDARHGTALAPPAYAKRTSRCRRDSHARSASFNGGSQTLPRPPLVRFTTVAPPYLFPEVNRRRYGHACVPKGGFGQVDYAEATLCVVNGWGAAWTLGATGLGDGQKSAAPRAEYACTLLRATGGTIIGSDAPMHGP